MDYWAEQEGPIGQEAISILSLAFRYQEELEELDPGNELLKFRLEKDGETLGGEIIGFKYPPAFGERFKGIPINKAVHAYYGQLQMEIKRLKAEKDQ